MRRSLVAGAITAALLAAGAHAAVTTISLNDGLDTTFTVELVGRVGNAWTYRVAEEQGKDLSHWVLGIECLLDGIESYTPAGGVEIGPDGAAEFTGIKWDVEDGFDDGRFSITLDDDYPQGTVQALVKAGHAFAAGPVAGPVCPPLVPSPGALVLGGIGTGLIGWLWRYRRLI